MIQENVTESDLTATPQLNAAAIKEAETVQKLGREMKSSVSNNEKYS